MSSAIEGWAREFLSAPRRFATLATLDPSGAPRQAVLWYALRDDGILVNSRIGRRWPANLLRDPRFDLVVHDGYDYVAVRGLAERLYDGARAVEDICALARAYHADPAKAEAACAEFRTQDRISFRLRPASVVVHR